jgi:cardiolipin synthase
MNQLTAANQLTLLRMVLIPPFAILLLYGYRGWALVVFLAAGITDLFDGLIARRTGKKTTLGAWLDPMADKLLLVSTFVMLTLPGLNLVNRFPIWLTVLVISRDIAIVLTVAVVNLAVARRTFRPSMLGKAATVIYVFTCGLTLIANYLRVHSLIVTIAIWTSLAVTLASGFDYVFRVTLFRSADVTDRQRVNQPDNRAAG